MSVKNIEKLIYDGLKLVDSKKMDQFKKSFKRFSEILKDNKKYVLLSIWIVNEKYKENIVDIYMSIIHDIVVNEQKLYDFFPVACGMEEIDDPYMVDPDFKFIRKRKDEINPVPVGIIINHFGIYVNQNNLHRYTNVDLKKLETCECSVIMCEVVKNMINYATMPHSLLTTKFTISEIIQFIDVSEILDINIFFNSSIDRNDMNLITENLIKYLTDSE